VQHDGVLKSTAISGIEEHEVKAAQSFHYAESTCPHCDLAAADSTYVHGESSQPPRAKAISPYVSTAEQCSLRQRNPLCATLQPSQRQEVELNTPTMPRTATMSGREGLHLFRQVMNIPATLNLGRPFFRRYR